MAFAIDQEHLPAVLTSHPMTDEEFAALCAEHPDLSFEMTAEGELIIMAATFSIPSLRNTEIGRQLANWAVADRRGFVSDSSGGFVLPNGARRSPDAAWMLKSRVQQMSPATREGFWHLCPDFIIELRSPSDRPRAIREKMQEWIENGAALAWLIEPDERAITVYRPGCDPEKLSGIDTLSGEGPVGGFVLDLPDVWDPLRDS
jgi:Uma2 family endonuclease